MIKKLKDKKLIASIVVAIIAIILLNVILLFNTNAAETKYESYVNNIIEKHVENGNAYIMLTGDYKKYSDKDMNIEKTLEKHTKAFESEIILLVADELTSDEYNKMCEELYLDLGQNHIKCDISVCMVDKEDLNTKNPDELIQDNKTLAEGHIN